MLRKKSACQKATSHRVATQKVVNQTQAQPTIQRFDGGSNKWVRKVEPTEASQKNSSKNQTDATNEVEDNLSLFDNQSSHLKTTTNANVEDGLDDLDLTNQDDVDPLDPVTSFETDDLIDLLES